MDQRTIEANGLDVAYFTEGPEDGPLALCLHGFPDTAHTWRHLLPELAAAGFRAVAPFLRGYAPTQVPADGRYQIGALVRDANALHEALGAGDDAVHRRARLGGAGHLRRRRAPTGPLAAGGHRRRPADGRHRPVAAHLRAAAAELVHVLLPVAPGRGRRAARRLLVHRPASGATGRPATTGRGTRRGCKESIGDPERLVAAIGTYRALYDASLQVPELAEEQTASLLPTPKPTLYLHGRDDGCMLLSSIGSPLDFMAEGSEMEIVDGAGHFLHLERPDVVNARIVGFLTAS